MSNDSSKQDLNQKSTAQLNVVPWNPWVGAIFAIFIFVFMQIVAGTLISLIPLILGWSDERAAAWLNDSAIVKVLYFVVSGILILLATRQFLKMESAKFIDLGLRKPKWSDAGYSLLAVPIYMIVFVSVAAAVQLTFPDLDLNQKQDLGFNGVYNNIELFLIGVALIVIAPVLEEIIFRGLLFGSLKKAMPVLLAAVITSLLFALGHIMQGENDSLLIIAAIDTFVLSLILVYLRLKSNGLWAPIGLHAIKNSIAFVSIFVLATI